LAEALFDLYTAKFAPPNTATVFTVPPPRPDDHDERDDPKSVAEPG
jgi:hypothetical protein